MGFFGRFKRKNEPEIKAPSELVFQSVGPFEVASCPGKDALAHLKQLQAQGRNSGFSVILLGGQEDADGLAENRECSETTPEECLRLAAGIDVDQWLKERVERDPECYSVELGKWPLMPPASGSILAHLDILSRKPKDIACLAKIPTSKNWEVPAYIGMGGWNDCPDDAALTAFAKRWYERYGAEIVSMTHDIIEFSVARPPTTREAALELAREQYIFCYDIVDQEVGDISTLAATLLNSNYWYFWWD